MTHAPGALLGPYRLVALIGQGGMGEVHRAKDPKLGREVAIKVLPAGFDQDPDRLRRFEQEARAASALNHPNILTIYELGTHEGIPYIVMELLEGETLREALRRGPMAWERAAELGEQLASGLAAAHDRGIVHRDLKPENLFITRDGVAKILDFGLAKRSLLDGFDSTAALGPATASGVVLGTISYMSPEQATGRPVDFHSDQFSLGVVLYEMVSGTRPFAGESAAETLAAIVRDDPPPLEGLSPGVPRPLAAIVGKCLAKAPKDRFASTRDLALQLKAAGRDGPPGRTAATGHLAVKILGGPRPDRRRIAAGLLGVALAVAGILLWRPWRQTPRPGPVPSVLALPAKVLGAPESAFLTDAIPNTLSTLLAAVEGLDTKLPPTSLQVEKAQGDLTKIAQAYQVEHLVLSTVTVQGESLVLDVKLAEAATQKVRWAAQFTGTRSAYTALAKEAADALARVLRPGAAVATAAPAERSEVELALQEGRYFMTRFGGQGRLPDSERSRQAFDRALQLSPASPRVLHLVAQSRLDRLNWGGDAPGALEEAETLARRALDLDPRCAAWTVLAMVEASRPTSDFDRMADWAVKAVRYAPRDAGVHGTLGALPCWRPLQLASGWRALELNPLDFADSGLVAGLLIGGGRPAEALPLLDRTLAGNPEDRFNLTAKAWALVRLHRLPEAKVLLDRCRPTPSGTIPFPEDFWNQVDFLRACAEEPDEATRALARRRLGVYWAPRPDGVNVLNAAFLMGPELMRLGLREETLRLLERCLEAGTPPAYDWLAEEPGLKPLRGDPRFQKVLDRARRNCLLVARHLSEARAAGELPRHLEAPLAGLKAFLQGAS